MRIGQDHLQLIKHHLTTSKVTREEESLTDVWTQDTVIEPIYKIAFRYYLDGVVHDLDSLSKWQIIERLSGGTLG